MKGLGPKHLHPGWDFLQNRDVDDDKEKDDKNDDYKDYKEDDCNEDEVENENDEIDGINSSASSTHQFQDNTAQGVESGHNGGGQGGGDGGDGGGNDEIAMNAIKNPPPDWKTWSTFQQLFECDCDGISITGSPKILQPILGGYTQTFIPSYDGKTKSRSTNTLLIASSPFSVFVNKDFKNAIIAWLNKKRNIFHKPATNDCALIFKNITLTIPHFMTMLEEVGIENITLKVRLNGGKTS